MAPLRLWQVDAFASRPFTGNPAAVVPLDEWLDDATMQAIAAENNLSETAFLKPDGAEWAIRWFTPTIEVNLCGHATLASAHVLFTHLEPARQRVVFASRSGPLVVLRDRATGRLSLDLPQYDAKRIETPAALVDALGGVTPRETWLGTMMLASLDRAADVRAIRPDIRKVATLDGLGLIVTAPGDDCDFVSRFFGPKAGIDEDPVTGSSHSLLAPFWSAKLGKTQLHARQVSARGGELWVEHVAPRVRLSGHVSEYLTGTIELAAALA